MSTIQENPADLTKNGKEEMEVDNKQESQGDKDDGSDHYSDNDSDNDDKDMKDNAEEKKPEKKEEKTDTPKKVDKPSNKTRKKPKKVESDDDGDSEDDEEDKVALLERPVVITGKRERKKVERIDVSSGATPKEKKLEVPEGRGTALGEIPNIEFKFGKTLADDLKPLHRFVYGRAGTASEIKKNLRKFCGFDFKKDSPEYTKKVALLNKMTMAQMKSMCDVLDLERGGTKETIVTRLMDFFLKPASSGKKLLADKKRKRSSSGKGKKTKTKRSKKEGKKDKKKKPKKKPTSKDSDIEDSDSDDEESDANEEGSDEEEKVKKKTKAPAKKKVPKKKDSDDEDDESENDEDEDDDDDDSEDEQPKKKRAKVEPKKEVKKTEKKSTPKKKKESDDESSGTESDDEPLVKAKSPKPPSDDELKEVIKKILDGANLEEVTMKTVCKQVYAKYEQFDLTDRKDFIKSTVKEIIR